MRRYCECVRGDDIVRIVCNVSSRREKVIRTFLRTSTFVFFLLVTIARTLARAMARANSLLSRRGIYIRIQSGQQGHLAGHFWICWNTLEALLDLRDHGDIGERAMYSVWRRGVMQYSVWGFLFACVFPHSGGFNQFPGGFHGVSEL